MENSEKYFAAIFFIICLIISLAFSVFNLFCRWKIFQKAGKQEWESIIPIYNLIVLLDIVKKPKWWILLLLIPFYNIYIAIVLNIRLAKFFGKDEGFGILLTFISFIFTSILALDNSQYLPNALEDERKSNSWT